jgi:DNA-binding LytR/AlgR family response regulator
VNVDKIRELRPWPTGEYVVVLRNGKELTFSRSYRWQLATLLADLGSHEDTSASSSCDELC